MSSESLVAFGVNEHTPALRFLASLSDGRTVIQDDRPGEPHAWHRLKDYLKAHPGLAITCLRLQAPNGLDMPMPPNQKGYVFGYASGVLLGAGSIREGTVHAEVAVALNPDSASSHNLLGVALAMDGRFEDALPHFREAVAIDPHDREALNNLARAVHQAGIPPGAPRP